ncbi:hypothetical protein FQN57_000682 [Myotisia sp. PD_48]|nr:hypothetical protein FQN57_000682 [Myotisia sp. PD_48]
MAAVTRQMPLATRQPLGVLGESRIRAVDSIKNQQNGLLSNPLKRRIDTSDNSDSENIDPLSLASPSKKLRGAVDSPPTCVLPDKFNLTSKPAALMKSAPIVSSPLARTIKPLASLKTPLRAAGGRVPKSKPGKAFGLRNHGYRRIDPPSMAPTKSTRAPFSIAQALNGTFTASRTTAEPVRKARNQWDFEIYADSEQEEMANLMEHSTCVLDISDDEEKRTRNDRGKENIPPPPTFDQVQTPSIPQILINNARIVEMSDEPRSPLGELSVKSFVPKGEDISSVIEIIDDDEEEGGEFSSVECILTPIEPKANPISASDGQFIAVEPELSTPSAVSVLVEHTAPASDADTTNDHQPQDVVSPAPAGPKFGRAEVQLGRP